MELINISMVLEKNVHALINITNTLLITGKLPVVFFVDFQKPFDTVNHTILLDKLKHYGIRKQYVSTCVPQGSVIGTLLFLIYINHLHRSISSSTIYHFADDTNHSVLRGSSPPPKFRSPPPCWLAPPLKLDIGLAPPPCWLAKACNGCSAPFLVSIYVASAPLLFRYIILYLIKMPYKYVNHLHLMLPNVKYQ